MEAFLALAKGAKGAACAQLISDVLAAPGIFVFSELLNVPNVTDLANNSAYASSLRLLQIFAYGSYAEYEGEKPTCPKSTPFRNSPPQLNKLKQLSIMAFAQSPKVKSYSISLIFHLINGRILQTIPYSTLQSYLNIPNIRDLEDLIIDAIYLGIVDGKLDQKNLCLSIKKAIGRDLKPGQDAILFNILNKWLETSSQILSTIDKQLDNVRASDASYIIEKEEFENRLEFAKSDSLNSISNRGFRQEHDQQPQHYYEDDIRRGSGSNRSSLKGGARHKKH
ncbi:COP9 signalosome complex subunit 7a [Physocladia obscura]|uniref:COP9 signalosome complex subunit 7a n=1 Tax=Physocladia obscura TaxID=109957 RepID=A0AAD5T7G0_9FUNG|nr:COP9 signalosome complex subunit 7a [Physocladia obscura]